MGRQNKDLGYIYFGLSLLSILKWWYLPLSGDVKKLDIASSAGRMLLEKTPNGFGM